MNDLKTFNPDQKSNFPLDQEGQPKPEQGDIKFDKTRSADKAIEGSGLSEIDDLTADSGKEANESLPSLDQINDQSEFREPLAPEAQAELLTKLVHADIKESFPKNIPMGTSAAEMQNTANEAGTQ